MRLFFYDLLMSKKNEIYKKVIRFFLNLYDLLIKQKRSKEKQINDKYSFLVTLSHYNYILNLNPAFH
jgi:hypothetical protein